MTRLLLRLVRSLNGLADERIGVVTIETDFVAKYEMVRLFTIGQMLVDRTLVVREELFLNLRCKYIALIHIHPVVHDPSDEKVSEESTEDAPHILHDLWALTLL